MTTELNESLDAYVRDQLARIRWTQAEIDLRMEQQSRLRREGHQSPPNRGLHTAAVIIIATLSVTNFLVLGALLAKL